MILGWNGERFDGKMCSQYWHYAGICQIQYRLYYLVNLRGEKTEFIYTNWPIKKQFCNSRAEEKFIFYSDFI